MRSLTNKQKITMSQKILVKPYQPDSEQLVNKKTKTKTKTKKHNSNKKGLLHYKSKNIHLIMKTKV